MIESPRAVALWSRSRTSAHASRDFKHPLFKPFFGFGAGGRSYAYEAGQLNDKTCLAGYGALGSEFQFGRMAIRFEARDNVFCYKSPIVGVDSKTRNDVGLALGLATTSGRSRPASARRGAAVPRPSVFPS